jgi:nucleoside-diphosphate-sugar epimerase
MRVLVLGAGLVGTFTARALADAGATVIAADAEPAPAYFERFGPRRRTTLVRTDIADSAALPALLARSTPDVVVVCTGKRPTGTEGARTAVAGADAGLSVLQHAVHEQRVGRLVLLSSLAVYGRPTARAVSECESLLPTTEYGRRTVAAENALAPLRRDGVDVRVLRSCGLYGPLRAGTGSRSARLVDLLLRHARAGRPLHIDAEGDGRDQYLYVKDLARAAAVAAFRDLHSPHWIFNVGPGEITTIDQLCSTLKAVVPTAKFTVRCTGEPHAPSGPLDVARVAATFGFAPAYSLREGLADYLRCESLVH